MTDLEIERQENRIVLNLYFFNNTSLLVIKIEQRLVRKKTLNIKKKIFKFLVKNDFEIVFDRLVELIQM